MPPGLHRKTLAPAVLAALAAFAITLTVSSRPASVQAAGTPPLDHVFVIVMENHSYSEVIGSPSAPYINSLANSGAVATNYFAVAHPSLPNYIALTSGDTQGITSDCTTCWLGVSNIGDRLESAGSTWKAYEESMPSACYVGDAYPYVQKHDPFIYYDDIRQNASRCQSHVVPYTQLATDLRSASTTPTFSFITPNACHDMHDCSVATGDAWLQQQVPSILASPAFTSQHSLLAITWDEDDFTTTNQVATIFVGAGVTAGTHSSTYSNHYSLLRTLEVARNLSPIAAGDASAAQMSSMFTSRTLSTSWCVGVSVSGSPAPPQQSGSTVQFSASASGCPTPEYEFWILSPGATMYTLLQPYSTSATATWSSAGNGPGAYRINVWVRDATSLGVYGNAYGGWDAYNASYVYGLASGCPSVTESSTPAATATAGSAVTFTASAPGCSSPQYEFWILSPGASLYTLLRPYGTSPSVTWSTVGNGAGVYRIDVWVRNGAGPGAYSNPYGSWDAYNASGTLALS